MAAPGIISDLIERFERNSDSYRAGTYNEAQARQEFINPFFDALGWDMDNKKGYAEAYKEVIHEFSLKTLTQINAPDYGFRVGGSLKFFVEAKKPSVNIKDDIHPAYQLRSYAWSSKLPLSILTDFEEFAVYDCRITPKLNDKADVGRIMLYHYSDYLNKWDEIHSIFSPDAILKGSFDKYAASTKNKKGTAEVDEKFLETLKDWREQLARNIALRNPIISTRELNYAVQKTIDRIIFLRICEDRGIEHYGQLLALENGVDVYKRLLQYFTRADEKYNSGLFHFEKEKTRNEEPDYITPGLIIDDKLLKEIFKYLYYPHSPFRFSVMPADILGQVYEQFLGKVIRLTDGHQAKVEDKPEVKKAGGVFYTPTYIVNYIIENTLGKLLNIIPGEVNTAAGQITPKEVSKIKVIDPACGSGSFLIVAYQYLLDWHLKYYTESVDPEISIKKNFIFRTHNGDLRLTTKERKRILLNNIFGVDIDSQAVEVTKLSLLLKVLEGETEQSIKNQMDLFRERALPDLSTNIKCGNSLIGLDFYDQMEIHFMDDDDKLKINVFDWETEFKEIMSAGGFDVVIGNPPYVRQELISQFKSYFESAYTVYHGVADLYSYFIEKGVLLLKEEGYFSYIVANKWMRANYGLPLREWLKTQNINEIIDFGDLPVFKGATTYPCIINISKKKVAGGEFNFVNVKTLKFESLPKYVADNRENIKTKSLNSSGWNLVSDSKSDLLNKLFSSGVPLSKYVNGKIYRGVLTGLNKAFVIDEETKNRLIAEDKKSEEIIKPFLAGRDIKRYSELCHDKYLIFTRRGINIKNYTAIENYLKKFKDELMPKPKDWKGKEWKGRKPGSYQWYEIQDSIDYHEEFEKPKIIVPAIVQHASYAYDTKGFYSNDKTTIIRVEDTLLLGLLNSKLLDFVMHSMASTKQGGYYEYKPMYLSRLPIVNIDDKNKETLIHLTSAALEYQKKLVNSKTPQEKTALHRQIESTDRQIDQLVYQLYGLTETEIKIVEGE